jgi:hypothetical protein
MSYPLVGSGRHSAPEVQRTDWDMGVDDVRTSSTNRPSSPGGFGERLGESVDLGVEVARAPSTAPAAGPATGGRGVGLDGDDDTLVG